MAPQRHDSSRVGLVNQSGRVLLHAVQTDPSLDVLWMTPGGLIESGESPTAAARREILEETGQAIDLPETALPAAVFTSTWTLETVTYEGVHRLYFAPAASCEVDPSGQTSLERKIIKQWRWWSVEEISGFSGDLQPMDLGSLLAEYLRHRHGAPQQRLEESASPEHKAPTR